MITRKYKTYLRSKEWKKKRKEALDEKGYLCDICKKTQDELVESLHVHHLTYKNLFNEKMEDLQILCVDCHNNTHKPKDKVKIPRIKRNKIKGEMTRQHKVNYLINAFEHGKYETLEEFADDYNRLFKIP